MLAMRKTLFRNIHLADKEDFLCGIPVGIWQVSATDIATPLGRAINKCTNLGDNPLVLVVSPLPPSRVRLPNCCAPKPVGL